jgi:hypothetical protein
MFNRLKQIKKLWNLSKKSPSLVEQLTDEMIDTLPTEEESPVYLSDMTDEEYKQYVTDELDGWGKFKKLWGITK